MALLASITPVSILNKQASYLRASIGRYDLMASECYVKYDLLNSSGEYVFGETYKLSPSVLQTWGTDDKVIIQAIASDRGMTITGYPTSI
jgi:hypothetical protein